MIFSYKHRREIARAIVDQDSDLLLSHEKEYMEENERQQITEEVRKVVRSNISDKIVP